LYTTQIIGAHSLRAVHGSQVRLGGHSRRVLVVPYLARFVADLVEQYHSLSISSMSHLKLTIAKKDMGTFRVYSRGTPRTVAKQMQVYRKFHRLLGMGRSKTAAGKLLSKHRVGSSASWLWRSMLDPFRIASGGRHVHASIWELLCT
jgi:hypothetical protein